MARSEARLDKLLLQVKQGTLEEARAAAETLGEMGARAEEASPDLVDLLAQPRAAVVWAIVQALATIAREDEEVIDDLLDGLRDPDKNIRWGSTRALGLVGKGAEDAIEDLCVVLRDPNGPVCWAAVEALTQIASESDQALDRLIGLLEDAEHNEHVLWGISIALGRLGPRAESAIPALDRLSKETNRALRWAAAEALKRIRQPH